MNYYIARSTHNPEVFAIHTSEDQETKQTGAFHQMADDLAEAKVNAMSFDWVDSIKPVKHDWKQNRANSQYESYTR